MKKNKFIIRKENGKLNVYINIEEIEETKKEIEEMGLFSGLARVISELETFRGSFLEPNEKARIKRIAPLLGTARVTSESEGSRPMEGRGHGGEMPGEEVYGREIHEREEREIPREIKTLFKIGFLLLKREENEDAYNIFNKITLKNPNLKSAWLNKGVAAGRLGKTDEEIDCYERALNIIHEGGEREIHEIELLFKIGVRLLKTGENKDAYNIFNKIILKNPNLKSAWLNKGVAAGRLGKTDEEIDCYERALDIDENYAKALVRLGIGYENRGDIDKAKECFEKLER